MSQIWDAKAVLELCDDGLCVGDAPSKRRKCTKPINYANLRAFNSIVRDLAAQQPDAEILRPRLEALAKLGLCIQVHRTTQIQSMVKEWSRRITAAHPPTPDETEETDLESPRETIGRLLETLVPLQTISTVANPNPTISRVSTSNISPLNLSRSSTIASNQPSTRRAVRAEPELYTSTTQRTTSFTETTRSHPPRPISATPTSRPPVRSQFATVPTPSVSHVSSVSTASSPSESPTRTRLCERTHVRRLPFDEECSICYDRDSLSDLDASALVWCRSGCGRTVHKSCFQLWSRQCKTNDRNPTCIACRTDWPEEDECECTEGCTHQHVRRRPVQDECPICCAEFTDEDGQPLQMSELAWCKAGCGSNVHTECFEAWKDQLENANKTPTCVTCRATWSDDCEC